MEEVKNKRVRGPRIYMGAPAEVVAQLKTIARKRDTHVSVLLLSKAYDLIEEHEDLLQDDPLVEEQQLGANADEQQSEEIEEQVPELAQSRVWTAPDEPVSAYEEEQPLQIHTDHEAHGIESAEQHVEPANAFEQQKGIFEGVRALWKKNSM